MDEDKFVTKDYLDAKLAAANTKFRFALMVQSVAFAGLIIVLYKILR
jgi:hypothetical protein